MMNYHGRLSGITVIVAVVLLVGCWSDSDEYNVIYQQTDGQCGDLTEMAQRSYTLNDDEKAAWHRSNLYDSATDSYYLPPELFYATVWDGQKHLEEPAVNYYMGYTFCNRVVGPETWTHPETGETLSIYRRIESSNTDYLKAGDQGFEVVFSTVNSNTYEGSMDMPSGFSWRIREPRTSDFRIWHEGVQSVHTQTIEIEEILFDSEGVLAWIVFRRSVDGAQVAELMLEPRRGLTRTYIFDENGYDGAADGYDCADKSEMAALSYALSDQEATAWSKANLYDTGTDSYYIPPELWTGAVWDGEKVLTPHAADLYFGTTFCKHITGPTNWTHPFNDQDYSIYTRTNQGTLQYFVITPNGFGRVYDNRSGGSHYENEVKFPAGTGWREGESVSLPYRRWKNGEAEDRIRRIEITRMVFDENDVLAALKYRYYAGSRGQILDHEYTYMPRRGMAYTHKFSD